MSTSNNDVNREGTFAPPTQEQVEKWMGVLDAVSQRLSTAGGRAVATRDFALISLIGESGCAVDEVWNEMDELIP